MCIVSIGVVVLGTTPPDPTNPTSLARLSGWFCWSCCEQVVGSIKTFLDLVWFSSDWIWLSLVEFG
jgi:hypothetical protein